VGDAYPATHLPVLISKPASLVQGRRSYYERAKQPWSCGVNACHRSIPPLLAPSDESIRGRHGVGFPLDHVAYVMIM
jgi:hypothetical protein